MAIKEKDKRRHAMTALFALFVAVGAPALAWAVPGFSTGNVNMRAGPSTANPVVATIPSGSPVEIVGCVSGWSWCDTLWAGYRGWVAGAYLDAAWQGRAVPFVPYAPVLAFRSSSTTVRLIGVGTTPEGRGSPALRLVGFTDACAGDTDALSADRAA